MSRLEKARSHFESILASAGDFLSRDDAADIYPTGVTEGVPKMASREKLIVAQRERDQNQQESHKQQQKQLLSSSDSILDITDRRPHQQHQSQPRRVMDTSTIESNTLSQSMHTHTHVLPAHYVSYGDRLRRLSDQTSRIERAAEEVNSSTKELTRDDKDDLIIAMQVQGCTASPTITSNSILLYGSG